MAVGIFFGSIDVNEDQQRSCRHPSSCVESADYSRGSVDCGTMKHGLILASRRLLTSKEAAEYCGVSVPVFVKLCPVRAVSLGSGARLRRFDRLALDEWIESLSVESRVTKNWLETLDA